MSTLVTEEARPGTSAQPSPARALHHPRLYVLDGLRLIAALMVVAFHFIGFDRYGAKSWWHASTADLFPTAHPVAAYGWLGVQLFFLISGFVICMSCWGRTPRDFLVSRLVRLFPAYWFCVAATAVVLCLPGAVATDGVTGHMFLTNLSMLQEPLGVAQMDGVYWSLWAEMRFYLLFAVVAVMGLTYRRAVVFCAAWLFGMVLVPGAHISLLGWIFQPTAGPFFVGGIVLYLMHRFRPQPVLWVLLGASWLLAQHQLALLVRNAEPSVHHHVSWAIAVAVVTLFYGVLLAAALGKLDFLNWPWLVTAGALTYPLYLLHEEIGWNVIERTQGLLPPHALLAVLVGSLLIVAWAVQRWVERPLARRLKSRLTRPPSSPRAGIEFDRTP